MPEECTLFQLTNIFFIIFRLAKSHDPDLQAPMILLIQDTANHKFGAYLSESLKILEKSYGSGETFVFQLLDRPKVYKWTAKNSLFILGSTDSFAIGIDDGKFALYLDSSLNQGRSQGCQTFANDPLTPDEDFVVKVMEIWIFR